MTKQDYILIADCVATCHNRKYELDDIIGYFRYRLYSHPSNKEFSARKFREYILEKTKPDHIPEEQAKAWATKKCKK
jgi:hypothetical protein